MTASGMSGLPAALPGAYAVADRLRGTLQPSLSLSLPEGGRQGQAPAAASRLANSSATSSFFDSLPTGVFGRLARNSISAGISYFASLSARKALSSSKLKA